MPELCWYHDEPHLATHYIRQRCLDWEECGEMRIHGACEETVKTFEKSAEIRASLGLPRAPGNTDCEECGYSAEVRIVGRIDE